MKARWVKFLFVVLFVIVVGLYCFKQWLATYHPVFIGEKWEQSVEHNADPFKLQAWATNLMAQPAGFSNGPVFVDNQSPLDGGVLHTKMPSGFEGVPREQFFPDIVIPAGTGASEPYVKLIWRSSFGYYWEMAIGSPTFVPRLPAKITVKEWKLGVYFLLDPN